MTKLDEILDINQLVTELQDGFVRERNHPTNPELKILNYTEKAQYDRHWNDVTRQCRGLIVDFPTGEILARPFDKFFNVGEYDDDAFHGSSIVSVTDKADGSLGILYTAPDGLPAIATRGSFVSDQAIHATEVLRTRYADFRPEAGLTYLFEILLPWNRIVLDYFGAPNPYVSQRPARDDRGQHLRQAERLEALSSLPNGILPSGPGEARREAESHHTALGRGEWGPGSSAEEGALAANAGGSPGGQGGAPLLGLRRDVSPGRDGLRSRSREEALQCRAGEDAGQSRDGDREVRAGLLELSQSPHPGSADGELVLLGMRNIETGRTHGPGASVPGMGAISWRGPRIEQFSATTYREALELGDRENREGLVITFANSGLMVKVKQEDYVRLHKLVTGLNERAVWEHLSEHNGNFDGLLASVPDEFHEWVRNVAEDLLDQFETLSGRAHHAYHHTMADLYEPGQEIERKTFALSVRNHYASLSGLLFQLLDGRDISAAVWKTLKPKGETASLLNRTEDNS